MENIQDYHRYTQLMRNGFYDKLFFIDKLFDQWSSLVDFGCAEGFQTKMIAQIFPDKNIIGFDIDPQMISLAKYSGPLPHNVNFTGRDDAAWDADVIFLSSTIHEVYSYAKKHKIKDFWDMVFNQNRKYVIIRDMFINTFYHTTMADNRQIIHAIHKYLDRINMRGELKRFEEIFLPLETNNPAPILHFLLKLPYLTHPNWNREIAENYLPLSISNMEFLVPDGWEIEYKESFTLPYLKWWWKKELEITIPYHTHCKFILKQ